MINEPSQRTASARHRVVVTGMGIASPLGVDEKTVWKNLIEGKTGIGPIRAIDTSALKVRNGAEVPEGLAEARLKSMGRRPSDRALDLAVVSAQDALLNAKLVSQEQEIVPQDVSVIYGTGVGSAESHYKSMQAMFEKGPQRARPTAVPRCMYNAISAGISLQFKLTGANYMIVSACTSATNAIGTAYRMVRDGYAQTVLTGGSDGFFDPFFYPVWNNIGVLSKIEDPIKACRPFAADREGTILGEGAGTLILETLESAHSRGVPIRGEVLGYGESSDATHVTNPSSEGQAKAMRMALNEAGVSPQDIGHINAHGTATHGNDACESKSIRSVFGDAADDVPVVANKSYFGHALGASGALECISAFLALEHGISPPNLNNESPDPECRIHMVGAKPVSIDSRPVMKNSFGFGGGNGVLVLGPSN